MKQILKNPERAANLGAELNGIIGMALTQAFVDHRPADDMLSCACGLDIDVDDYNSAFDGWSLHFIEAFLPGRWTIEPR